MSLTPGMRLGSYEIVSLLGSGGMGEVYRARDARLDRDVAIKVLPEDLATDPDRVRRFQLARSLDAIEGMTWGEEEPRRWWREHHPPQASASDAITL